MAPIKVVHDRSWLISSGVPAPPEGEAHVWRAGLDRGAGCVCQLARTLCDAERAKAGSFLFPKDRNRFVVRRGILRDILAGYLKTPANELQFRYGHYGKPHLADRFAGSGLRFSLSHSDGMAVFAFSSGREIGVDLERIRADIPCDEMAAHLLSRRESRLLQGLQGVGRWKAFFTVWTCKEAYVKAKGCGLSFPLDRVDLALSPLAFRRIGDDEHEASRWSLRELVVGDDYAAALAVEGHDWRLVSRQWQWVDAE